MVFESVKPSNFPENRDFHFVHHLILFNTLSENASSVHSMSGLVSHADII